MFEDIDAQLKAVKQKVEKKRSLEGVETELSSQLIVAQQSRYDIFQAIQWLKEQLEVHTQRKQKGKGYDRPNQIHAELFEAETKYKAAQTECDRLEHELGRIQADLKQFVRRRTTMKVLLIKNGR